MLAMMNGGLFFEHEGSRFTGSTLTLDSTPYESSNIDEISPEDSATNIPKANDCKKLQRLLIKNSSRTTPSGMSYFFL